MIGLRSNEDLVRLYRETKEESYIKALIEENKPLIVCWASIYQIKGYDLEDLVQEGYIELVKAVEHYEEAKGIKFITFLKACIKRRYNGIYDITTRQKRGGAVEDLLSLDDEENRLQSVTIEDYSEIEVEAFIDSLSPTYKDITVRLVSGYSLSQIAEDLGVTNATISYYMRRIRALTNAYFML